MVFANGERWLLLAGFMVGLRPSPIPDRVQEVAQAQKQLLAAVEAHTPDHYDRIRAQLSSLITSNPSLRFHQVDHDQVTARTVNDAVTPELRSELFTFLYTLYRLFVDDPPKLAACALAGWDLSLDDPPA
jgi:hypothetical protein